MQIKVNEKGLGLAIQRYLQDCGYDVHKLQMIHDNMDNSFYALAEVKKV